MAIDVRTQDFKRAFEQHAKRYNSNNMASINSDKLLLFYAVECGLKYLILNSHKKRSYDDFKDILFDNRSLSEHLKGTEGHDIIKLLKFLGITRFKLNNLITKRKNEEEKCIHISVKEFNQAWRYGIECEENRENEVEEVLRDIMKYIKSEFETKRFLVGR